MANSSCLNLTFDTKTLLNTFVRYILFERVISKHLRWVWSTNTELNFLIHALLTQRTINNYNHDREVKLLMKSLFSSLPRKWKLLFHSLLQIFLQMICSSTSTTIGVVIGGGYGHKASDLIQGHCVSIYYIGANNLKNQNVNGKGMKRSTLAVRLFRSSNRCV